MEKNELIDQLNDFITKTKNHSIPWEYLNQNTFRWIKTPAPNVQYVSTLQYNGKTQIIQNGQNIVVDLYYLTIQQVAPQQQIILQISTQEEKYAKILEEIFNTVKQEQDNISANKLKDLLSGL